MPEGPEIRRAADRIAAVLIGKPLNRVWFGQTHLRQYSPELAESIVLDVRTKGKAMLTDFACGLTVYSHNQLYGRWYVKPAGERPKTNRQLRWLMETEKRAALLYSASDIAVLATADLGRHPFLARAGLDVLSDRPSVKELSAFMAQPKFARRGLSSLLLDQGFVAGIGNYLRSEILFCSRLHPTQRLGQLDGHHRRRLATQTIKLTERAYETGGITNDPKLVSRLKRQGVKRNRFRHWVFGRMGAPCHICGEIIRKQSMAGRRLYWCPGCQQPAKAETP